MALTEKTRNWLAKNCPVSLKGKTVLVTGSNSGVGFKTAEDALYLGADVILACRNMDKANKAREELLRDYPNGNVKVMKLDIASFASIDAFVEEMKANHVDVDAFVNNAGVFNQPGKQTADGFDLVIGTNYIDVVYITKKLLPYLETLPHDVIYVNTVSISHKLSSVDYDDFYLTKNYGKFNSYGRSKLALAKYTYDLAQKKKGSNVKIYMTHPGIAMTTLTVASFGAVIKFLVKIFGGMFNSPEKSSLALSYIMSHNVPVGSIVGPNGFLGGWGYPEVNKISRKVKVGADELNRFTDKEIESKAK